MKFYYRTFLLLKNSILQHLGTVLCALIDSEFAISRGLMVQFNADQIKEFLLEKNKGDVQTSYVRVYSLVYYKEIRKLIEIIMNLEY